MLWYIDLIYGIWMYNDELQINCTFCFGPMIFGRVMALGFWNVDKYLVVISFFAMLGDIDLIFGIWVYNDALQIKFTFSSGPMIFGQLAAVGLCNLVLSGYSGLKFGQIFSWRHFFFTMIWNIDLMFGTWVHSDELPIKVEFRSDWANLCTLDF
jgi:hypothetical protein